MKGLRSSGACGKLRTVTEQATHWDRPELLASDADREHIAALLRHHSLEGRLTHDDLDERLGETYGARTIGQLWQTLRDLPVERAAAPVPHPAPQGNSTAGKMVVWTLVGVAAVTVAPVAVALVFGLVAALLGVLFGLTVAFAPVIAIGALIVLLVQRGLNRPAARSWASPPPA